MPDVNIKRCANKNNISWLEKIYPEFNPTLYYHEILDDPEIDAVIIAVPHSELFQVTKDALLSGKHVFVEKPMSSTYQEASELVSLKREGQVLFVGYRFMYDPIYNILIKIIDKDPAVSIDFNWNKFGTFGNDILLNLAPHDIAMSLGFFNDFPETIVLKNLQDDSCVFKLIFSEGRYSKISIDRLYPKTTKEVHIVTKSGRVFHWIDKCLFEVDRESEMSKVLYLTDCYNLEKECSAFISAVKNNTECVSNCILAYDTLRVIDQIHKNHLNLVHEYNINLICKQCGDLPTIDLLSLFPKFNQTVDPYSFLDGTSSPLDIALLKAFSQTFTYCKYLEIGTWRGESIANICDIVDKSVSIDLSEYDLRKHGFVDEKIANMRFFLKNNSNIQFITHDSQTYDFSELKSNFDLIFVDGAHDHNSVKNDTENVFKLLKDENSVIVWHDYLSSQGKVRKPVHAGILEGCPVEKRKDLYHVSNTLCAVYINPVSEFKIKVEDNLLPTKSFEVSIKCKKIS